MGHLQIPTHPALPQRLAPSPSPSAAWSPAGLQGSVRTRLGAHVLEMCMLAEGQAVKEQDGRSAALLHYNGHDRGEVTVTTTNLPPYKSR